MSIFKLMCVANLLDYNFRKLVSFMRLKFIRSILLHTFETEHNVIYHFVGIKSQKFDIASNNNSCNICLTCEI